MSVPDAVEMAEAAQLVGFKLAAARIVFSAYEDLDLSVPEPIRERMAACLSVDPEYWVEEHANALWDVIIYQAMITRRIGSR